MRNTKRVLALCLLLALTLPFTACGSGGSNPDAPAASAASGQQTDAATTVPVETELTRENAVSAVPDMDLKGIVVKIGYVDKFRYIEDIIGEDNGDVVSEVHKTLNDGEQCSDYNSYIKVAGQEVEQKCTPNLF